MAGLDFLTQLLGGGNNGQQHGGSFDINAAMSDPRVALGIGLLSTRTPQEGIAQGMGLLSKQSEVKRQKQMDELERLYKTAQIEKAKREIELGPEAPSNVREYEYWNSLSPSDQERFLNVKRANQTLNLGGSQAIVSPTGAITSQYPVTPRPDQMPGFEADVERARKDAELAATKAAGKGKAEAALTGFEQQAKIVTDTIDKATGVANGWSTGYGSVLSGIPNTDAGALKNYLETIKANVGFDKLQQMRENSPTGGALGAISDKETALLQAVSGALDPAQPQQMLENLKQIKSLYPQVMAEKRKAFDRDYSGGGMAAPSATETKNIGGKEYEKINGEWYEK